MWLRKKTQNLPTSCTRCRLNPHNQLSRICVYGIYKRSLRAPTKENALVLIAVDIGGKNTEEEDQIRIRAAPTAGPEISTVLEGILGRWSGLWLQRGKGLCTAVTPENIYYSYVLTYYVDSLDFFPFFPPILELSFYWHYEIELRFWALFFLSHIFYCCYKPLPLYWAFAILWSFPFYFSFLILLF